MKNLLIKLLACILVLTMMLTFAACKDTGDTNDDADKNAGADTDTDTDTDTDGDDFWGDDPADDDADTDTDTDDDLPCASCVDEDGDLKCDVCGSDVEPLPEGVLWTPLRGKNFFQIPYDGTKEFDFTCDKDGKTWQWSARVQNWADFKDIALEEGVIETTITPGANVGIFFGAVGMEVPADGGKSFGNADNVKYYWARYDAPGRVGLYMDEVDQNTGDYGQTVPVLIQEVAITDIDANYDAAADVTIKVEFTADGDITLYVNGIEAFSVEGYRPFGTQFGMMIAGGEGFTPYAVVGTVKTFTYSDQVEA